MVCDFYRFISTPTYSKFAQLIKPIGWKFINKNLRRNPERKQKSAKDKLNIINSFRISPVVGVKTSYLCKRKNPDFYCAALFSHTKRQTHLYTIFSNRKTVLGRILKYFWLTLFFSLLAKMTKSSEIWCWALSFSTSFSFKTLKREKRT